MLSLSHLVVFFSSPRAGAHVTRRLKKNFLNYSLLMLIYTLPLGTYADLWLNAHPFRRSPCLFVADIRPPPPILHGSVVALCHSKTSGHVLRVAQRRSERVVDTAAEASIVSSFPGSAPCRRAWRQLPPLELAK